MKKRSKKNYKTNRLFPRTSTLIGMGSISNPFGNYFEFNYSKSETEADRKALENDWGIVGNDIRISVKKAVLS